MLRIARVTLVVTILALVGCGRAVPMNPVTPVALTAQVDPQEIRAAILRAMEARQFALESDEPGRVVGRFSRRGLSLQLAIDYSPNDLRVTYLDSQGMGYRESPGGQTTISRRYNTYVERLRRTILDEVARPAREREEAIERDRQHQIQLAQAQSDRERAALEAEQRERDRERQAQLEVERLRTERARAQADARRPIVVQDAPGVVFAEAPPPVVARVRVSERPVRARFQSLRVGRRSRTQAVLGQTEGRIDGVAAGLPASCPGHFEGRPEHLVRVRRGVPFLRLETDARADVTLAVIAPSGAVYCDDDGGEGLNARISGAFPPGTYQVFVGSYRAGTSAGYRLLVSPDRAAPAVVARRTVGPAPTTVRSTTVRSTTRFGRGPAPAPADCRTLVIQHGHAPSGAVHCTPQVHPRCARAVLAAGHAPSGLVHCAGVELSCAEASMSAGHPPSSLVHCR